MKLFKAIESLVSDACKRLLIGWPLSLCIYGVGLIVAGARLMLIGNLGSEIPFLDQWGGEAFGVYRPWLKGELSLHNLIAPHNEHRILFTRLFDLALLCVNRQWNPRVEMAANTLLPFAFTLILVAAGFRYLQRFNAWIFSLAVLVFFSTSASYGNTLWGFQSQFYFWVLFSLLHVGLVFLSKPFRRGWWLGHVIGVANLFTNAAGVLSSGAVAAVSLYSIFFDKNGRKERGITFTIASATAVSGFLLSPARQGRDPFAPQTAAAFGTAVGNMFSWPFSAMHDSSLWFVVFGPAAVWVAQLVFTSKRRLPFDHCLLALVIVACSQNLLLALYRGVAWSRYLDGLALGIIVNAACLLRWRVRQRWSLGLSMLALAWLLFLSQALYVQQKDFEKRAFPSILPQTRADLFAIRKMVRTGKSPPNTTVAGLGADGVSEVVTDPAIQPILPPSLRLPLPLNLKPGEPAVKEEPSEREELLLPWPLLTTYRLLPGVHSEAVTSPVLQPSTYAIMLFASGKQDLLKDNIELRTLSGESVHPSKIRETSIGDWKAVTLRIPSEAYILVIHRSNKQLRFSEPVALPWLTCVVEGVLAHAAWISWAGAALFCMGTMGLAGNAFRWSGTENKSQIRAANYRFGFTCLLLNCRVCR